MKLVQGFSSGLITIPGRCDSIGLNLLKEGKVDLKSHGRVFYKKTYYISEFTHKIFLKICVSVEHREDV